MDRRLLTRIQIPGARVQVKKTGSTTLFSGLSKAQDIINLSKSGLCFQTSKKLDEGKNLQMKLSFPDGKNINLKGQIRWHNGKNGANGYAVGIQFSPFGTSNNYNSIAALDYLRSLNGLELINLRPE